MEPYRSTSLPILRCLVVFGLSTIVLWLGPAAAQEGPLAAQEGPLEVIEASNQRILELYAGDSGDADSDVSQRVFDVMEEVTSFDSIADAAIDGLCDVAAGDDCDAFKGVFKELLRVSSVQKLGRYRADSFEYLGEAVDGDTAIVSTLAHYGEDAIEVDYAMVNREGSWVIENYVVDGVDTIKNYRKQFGRMLGNRSVEFVTERLSRRTEELREDT